MELNDNTSRVQVDRVIGAVRLQQSRVKQSFDCSVPFAFDNHVDDCYPDLGDNHDDTPYGGSCLAVRRPARVVKLSGCGQTVVG